MIEVEVHQQLRAFLREQGKPYWSHHLTMARLVARALRLGRSALIQTDALSWYQGRYRLSYLVSILMWQGPVVLVATEAVQQRLLMVEIPQLRQWIQTPKPICTGDRFPNPEFQGLLLTTPDSWLSDRLGQQGRFPDNIPTILDGVDDLEIWTHRQLTAQIQSCDWDELMLACPTHTEAIRDARVQLTKTIFQRPPNPYECCLLEPYEHSILNTLFHDLHTSIPHPPSSYLPSAWKNFWQSLQSKNQLLWAEIVRRQGQFSLNCGPVEVASALNPIWSRQPVVLIGGALDLDTEALVYRQRMGLDDLTCLKFSSDRQDELIQLYLPDRLPMPNTPEFQQALIQEMHTLLRVSSSAQGLTVLLVGDVPLKAQVGSVLASEFGSRVQVERTCLDENGVLVTGWEYWRQHQSVLPAPQLLAIATLPIPSLENPLVAGRVAYYKHQRQDWFRLYLLPEALSELQRAIAPIRENQGIVALLDSRVIHRNYGHQVLAALNPLARLNYLDASLFSQPDYLL
ncbi:ATP-dependent DNA helicase [Kovacikia minuta CCNUW1]|uniref:helicase C-terminal domain-containing protein n=1 Tax=Kovacikia minuta TaxID=2931930 RepID=UPI001CCA40B5|nr:helicase C-terminal domain-containing protein [Kovacikia minuta]UBF23909.1 ATP-dependent DNA helicase [Kovacikia minuta CCNUW1]